MPRIRPENTETRPGNMRKMPSTARTWQKPGRKATALPPGKGPVLLKSGQIQPGSGRKVMPTRTELQMQDLLKPGQRLLGPGRKVQQNRMGFPEPSPPRPGQKHLPKVLPKHPPVPRPRTPVPKPLPAVQRQPKPPRKRPPPRPPWPGKVPRVPPRNWLRCRSI